MQRYTIQIYIYVLNCSHIVLGFNLSSASINIVNSAYFLCCFEFTVVTFCLLQMTKLQTKSQDQLNSICLFNSSSKLTVTSSDGEEIQSWYRVLCYRPKLFFFINMSSSVHINSTLLSSNLWCYTCFSSFWILNITRSTYRFHHQIEILRPDPLIIPKRTPVDTHSKCLSIQQQVCYNPETIVEYICLFGI